MAEFCFDQAHEMRHSQAVSFAPKLLLAQETRHRKQVAYGTEHACKAVDRIRRPGDAERIKEDSKQVCPVKGLELE
ncbi:hypothetical protein D3C87_1799210 [compost metagenome]